jgi:hypothetical protein
MFMIDDATASRIFDILHHTIRNESADYEKARAELGIGHATVKNHVYTKALAAWDSMKDAKIV